MNLTGLTEFVASAEATDSLTLPYGGREYVVRAPGAARGLRCAAAFAALAAGDRDALAAALGEDTLWVLALGADVVAQMGEDDVPARVVQELTLLALIAFTKGEDAANTFIANRIAAKAGEPESPKARPSRRRTGTSTAAASTTRRRASTSGTTSHAE